MLVAAAASNYPDYTCILCTGDPAACILCTGDPAACILCTGDPAADTMSFSEEMSRVCRNRNESL